MTIGPETAREFDEVANERLEVRRLAGWLGGFARHRWTSTGHEIRLGLRNTFRREEPAVGDVPVVVSMTSYGKRLRRTSYLALESIARGKFKPQRLILWVDETDVIDNPPDTLRRLRDRGLEILPCEDYGPHKKYYPYVASIEDHVLPLVTADDDVIYSYDWLADLALTHLLHPQDVVCMRAHEIGLVRGVIAPYLTWRPVLHTTASLRHFATGVSGVLHPAKQLNVLREAGTGFVEQCPRADDIWLHVHALRNGTRVRQVGRRPRDYREIERPWQTGLFTENGYGGANDAQIAALYTRDDVDALLAESPR